MLLTTMQTDSIIHGQLWRIYNPTSHEENEYLALFRICIITPPLLVVLLCLPLFAIIPFLPNSKQSSAVSPGC